MQRSGSKTGDCDGDIELIVPNIRTDNGSIIDCNRETGNTGKRGKSCQEMANEIDRKCRYIFPISFLITNLIYWTTIALMS